MNVWHCCQMAQLVAEEIVNGRMNNVIFMTSGFLVYCVKDHSACVFFRKMETLKIYFALFKKSICITKL